MEVLLFDIETTSLDPFVETDNLEPRILVICCMRSLEDRVTVIRGSEIEILKKFMDILSESPEPVCTYNGYSFDIPFIIARCLLNNVDPTPLLRKEHIDLYYVIKNWLRPRPKGKMNLKEMARIFGVEHQDPLAGSSVIAIYRLFRETNDPKYFELIVEHCVSDVLTLRDLYKKLEKIVEFDYEKRFKKPVPKLSEEMEIDVGEGGATEEGSGETEEHS